ncbi:MAG: hypothetical protein A2033_10455 [Bacteroidetes bacterium GWA2_31_9]|nr:MAG: hypothetical protein A2033_10455 [Bacteroidetes bacterium GWA2_31_9]
MAKDVFGYCSVCNEYTKLTFEHIPPKKSFNNKPIFIKNYNSLFDEKSHYYGSKRILNQGSGDFTLCRKCNSNTGDWYGRDYISWSEQGNDILIANKGKRIIACNFKIKPLNVLKQLFSFFLSLDKMGVLKNYKELVKFVLEKDNNILSEKFKIYMYLNYSSIHRFIGYSYVAGEGISSICRWSEINFKPFGFLFCDDSPPANSFLVDITFFKNFSYNQLVVLNISLFYLDVPDLNIGLYK